MHMVITKVMLSTMLLFGFNAVSKHEHSERENPFFKDLSQEERQELHDAKQKAIDTLSDDSKAFLESLKVRANRQMMTEEERLKLKELMVTLETKTKSYITSKSLLEKYEKALIDKEKYFRKHGKEEK